MDDYFMAIATLAAIRSKSSNPVHERREGKEGKLSETDSWYFHFFRSVLAWLQLIHVVLLALAILDFLTCSERMILSKTRISTVCHVFSKLGGLPS